MRHHEEHATKRSLVIAALAHRVIPERVNTFGT
jgi:hypothetical protein